MVFVDRQSKYPNRWTMKKSDGSSEVVTLIRNDEPTVEGTPMNAATLNELSTVAGALNAKEAAAASAAEALASQKAAKTSETNAYNSEFAAKNSATAAATSQSAAKTSETNAASSATAASSSATAAAASQKAAKTSETNASSSATAAANSQSAAKTSETNASGSASAAATSQKAAKTSETNAESSAKSAATSATAAANSQAAAKTSETNAASSASTASDKASAAATSATSASGSASTAASKATAAANSAAAAANSQTAAKTSETNAAYSATNASSSASAAASSASAAKTSETNAKASQTSAASSASSAKEYLEKVQQITEGAQGWFATGSALKSALPNGSNGWWAIVGETDTIWVWDGDTSKWVNTATNIDAYTKAQSDAMYATFFNRRGNVSNTDANTATNEGIYHYGGAAKNFYCEDDTNAYGRLLVFNSKVTGVSGESQTWLWQVALATYPKAIWWRNRVNTEDWSGWRRVTDNVDYDTLNSALNNNTSSINALNDSVSSLLTYQTKEYSWNATVKGATWSRLCLVAAQSNIIGSSFLLNVAATRNSVVYNETFAIGVNHSSKASIVKLSTAKYSTIQLRCTVDASGNAYVELYDNAQSMTSSETQSVTCRLVGVRAGTVTLYTAFTDGSTLAEGYSVGAALTVDSYSLQSSDGIAYAARTPWSGLTGKPELYTKSEVDALIERMKYMDGKLVYTAGVSLTSSKSATITVGSNVDYIIASAPGGINAYSSPSSSSPAVVTGPATGTKVARGCSANVMVFNCSSSSSMTNAFADGYSPVTFDESGTITFGKSNGYSTGFVNVEGYQYV